MDKKLNEVTKVTDMAYVPVIMSDGSIGQIAKSDLASVVAGVMNTNKLFPFMAKGTIDVDEMDNVKSEGIYLVAGTNPNDGMADWGTLVVFSSYSGNVIQMFYPLNNYNEVYKRSSLSGTWNPWYRLDNFGFNSLAELAGGVAGQIGIKSQEYTTVKSGESFTLTSTYGFCFLTSNQDEHVFFHHTYSRLVNIIFQTDTVVDYTNVKDTEGTVNIYKSSSDNLVVQNKTSKDYGIRILLIGQ